MLSEARRRTGCFLSTTQKSRFFSRRLRDQDDIGKGLCGQPPSVALRFHNLTRPLHVVLVHVSMALRREPLRLRSRTDSSPGSE